MKRDRKEPLYRKVNTKAIGVHHNFGSDSKHTRNTKSGMTSKMKSGVQRGLDYTPLYRFLFSKIGQPWEIVHSEAISRLDKEDPIYYMVQINNHERGSEFDYFCNENSYWTKLIVDDNGILQLKNSNLKNEDFSPSCHCCTHTFNGKPLIKSYHKSE
jgi:hypothetical protein